MTGGDARTEQDARRRERRWFWFVGVIAAVAALAGGIVGARGASDGSLDTEGSLLVLGVVAGTLVVIGAVSIGFVVWRRRRGSRLLARSPLWELPHRRDRTALVKALRRGDPIRPEQRDLGRRVARDFARRRNLIWVYVALAVVFGLNAAVQDTPFVRYLMIAVVVLYVGIIGYYWWLIRRMREAEVRLTG